VTEIREHPPLSQEMSMMGPLGGDARDPGTPTINTRNIDGGAFGPYRGLATPDLFLDTMLDRRTREACSIDCTEALGNK
jgi:hypothetical protein